MKVCLVNPSIREHALPTFVPSGLGYLAWFLEKEGHECDILDLNAERLPYKDVPGRLMAELGPYDIVGFTGHITNYLQIKEWCAVVKKAFPDKLIVVGGPVVTAIAHIFITKTKADVIVEGEGELILVNLVNAYQEKKDISTVLGLTIRDKEGKPFFTGVGPILASLDELPVMPWEKFKMDVYLANNCLSGYTYERSINICGSRGCPYRCNFCFDGRAERQVRFRSAKLSLQDIKAAYDKYRIQYFRWDDELFVANLPRAEEFCHGMVRMGLARKVKWGSTGRVNIVTPKLLALMHKAGCIDINYGIESGSDRMLKNMNKVTTRELGLRAIRWTKEAGITPLTSFMVGTRGEDEESINETVTFLKEADILTPEIFFTTPNPGTELWDYCKKAGQIKDEEKFIIAMCRTGDFSVKPLVNITSLPTPKFIELKRRAERQMYKNYLLNNKFRIPKMAYERVRKVGVRKFARQCFHILGRLRTA